MDNQELSVYATIWVPTIGFVKDVPEWFDESSEFKTLDLTNPGFVDNDVPEWFDESSEFETLDFTQLVNRTAYY